MYKPKIFAISLVFLTIFASVKSNEDLLIESTSSVKGVGGSVKCIAAATRLASQVSVLVADSAANETLYAVQAGFYTAAEIIDIYFACAGESSSSMKFYVETTPSSEHQIQHMNTFNAVADLVDTLNSEFANPTDFILNLAHILNGAQTDEFILTQRNYKNSVKGCTNMVENVYDDAEKVVTEFKDHLYLHGIRNSLWTCGDSIQIYFNCTGIPVSEWEKAITKNAPKSVQNIYSCANGMKNAYDSFKEFVHDLDTSAGDAADIETVITILNDLEKELPLCESVANDILGTSFNTTRTDNVIADLSNALTVLLDNYPLPPPKKTTSRCNQQMNSTYTIVSSLIHDMDPLDFADLTEDLALFADAFIADKMNCNYSNGQILSKILYQFLGSGVQKCIKDTHSTIQKSINLYKLYEKGASTARILLAATQLLSLADDTIHACASLV